MVRSTIGSEVIGPHTGSMIRPRCCLAALKAGRPILDEGLLDVRVFYFSQNLHIKRRVLFADFC